MKHIITSHLKSFGISPHPLAMEKLEIIQGNVSEGKLPTPLQFKCEALSVNLPNSTITQKINDLTQLIFLLPAKDIEARSLTLYALAYFWEENDKIQDYCESGLDDDKHIIHNIHRIIKNRIDDLRLRLARPSIQDAWLRA